MNSSQTLINLNAAVEVIENATIKTFNLLNGSCAFEIAQKLKAVLTEAENLVQEIEEEIEKELEEELEEVE